MITIPGKIPIRIYPFFWLLVLIIGWVNSFSVIGTMAWALVIFVSVLVHEYGHALTAMAFGQQARIELVGLGGVTHRQGGQLKLWQDFIVVINGPLFGFLLFLAAYYVFQKLGPNPPQNIYTYIIKITAYANLFWTIINLLPVHPLDGGRLLSIILEALFGMRGVKISLFISSAIALIISLLFFAMGSLLIGSLFILLAFESYRAWKSSLDLTKDDQNTTLQQMLKTAEDRMRFGQEDEAIPLLKNIREQSRKGMIYVTASEFLASILRHQGNIKEAYEMLAPLESKLSPDALRLLHQLAYQNGALKSAIAIGDRSYQVYPSYDTALTNAFCYALLGEARPATGWLQRAIGDGLPNPKIVLDKPEFDNIRQSPPFQELLHKY